MGYHDAAGAAKARLRSITECGWDATAHRTCYPPTQFEWHSSGEDNFGPRPVEPESFESDTYWPNAVIPIDAEDPNQIKIGDFDGNGKADLLYIYTEGNDFSIFPNRTYYFVPENLASI